MGVVRTFFVSSIVFSFFLFLSLGDGPIETEILSQRALNPKQPTDQLANANIFLKATCNLIMLQNVVGKNRYTCVSCYDWERQKNEITTKQTFTTTTTGNVDNLCVMQLLGFINVHYGTQRLADSKLAFMTFYNSLKINAYDLLISRHTKSK